MYTIDRIIVKKNHPLYGYLDENAKRAKALYNASLFRLRNHFTARGKTVLTANEQFVEDEIASFAKQTPGSIISAFCMLGIMVKSGNPDYYSGLPSQTAQHVVMQACEDFKNWIKALKKWKKDPSSFTGMPKIPHYEKQHIHSYLMTSQGTRIKDGILRLPKTDITLRVRNRNGNIRQMTVTPYHGSYLLCLCFETEDTAPAVCPGHAAAIDFGVSNIMAVVSDTGNSVLFKGGAVKSENRYFNKTKAILASAMTKGHPSAGYSRTHRLASLSMHRGEWMRDTFHKMSCRLMEWCLENDISTLALGSNKGWKQHLSIGKQNNQTFVSIPFDMLKGMLRYKAERLGIQVIEQEESYTSKASFLDGDSIPVLKENGDTAHKFSGRRISRGLYQSREGIILNADINAAANILRKAGFNTTKIVPALLQTPFVLKQNQFNNVFRSNG